MSSRNERSRAVYWVENPGQAGCGGLCSKFFAKDSIIWPLAFDQGAKRLFGGHVGKSDWIKRTAFRQTFVCYLDPLAEIRPNHGTRGVRELVGKGYEGTVDKHRKTSTRRLVYPISSNR